jgi:hypothetical protein
MIDGDNIHWIYLNIRDAFVVWTSFLDGISEMITVIRRKRKVEAVKAMNYLVERGFTIIDELQEVKTNLVSYGAYNRRYSRYETVENHSASCWYCKLEAPEVHNDTSTL